MFSLMKPGIIFRTALCQKRVWLFGILASFSSLVFAVESIMESRYQLGSGDKIIISVYGEEDMHKEMILSDTGTVSYPFLGEFRVKGYTVGELEKLITARLKDGYFVDPRVSVSIKEYRKFFVSGEVKNPGGFYFEPGLTIDKAVALAGGFTQRAAKKGIIVTREENDHLIDYSLALNDTVLPGDIIVIKESFF